MSNLARLSLLTTTAAFFCSPALAQDAVSPDVAALVDQVVIAHETFQLDNGLTVIVHEDRKAPVVAVSMWYNVGSKDEPEGKTGFAHLFEHLMFNGSENLPGEYFTYTNQIGATDLNGTTWFDRTNYFQTVPKGALERALFMESDRMGYLLGAVTQEKLDNQRSVVQNEKRQGDNAPGGLVEYEVLEALFPVGHPYQHDTIGSMADLDSASLGDVQQWFVDKYGPNNAIIVLAGDIDAQEARPLVEKYFGSIARGKVNTPAAADIPTLEAPKRIVMNDRVPTPQVSKEWAIAGLVDEDYEAMEAASLILGGLASSRLDNQIVRGEEIATSASTSYTPFQRLGRFTIRAEAKEGQDIRQVERRMQEILLQFVTEGPTQDEMDRAISTILSSEIRGLEQVGGFGGKATALAEGQLYADNSDFYAETLRDYASLTPEKVRSAAAKWLVRPPVTVLLQPGQREPYVEPKPVENSASAAALEIQSTKRDIPAIGETPSFDFPDVEHAELSNGVKVHYIRRDVVPVTRLTLRFDAGSASDPREKRGLAGMAMDLLDEGARNLDAQGIAERKEALGAVVATANDQDYSDIGITALSTKLVDTLDLVSAMVKEASFDDSSIERVRAQRLNAIEQAMQSPSGLAARIWPSIIYGEDHPYAGLSLGDAEAIAAMERNDFATFRVQRLRPDKLEIFAVSDLPLSELTAKLDTAFGKWVAPSVLSPPKTFVQAPASPEQPEYVLIDLPDTPQSFIYGVQLLDVDARSEMSRLYTGNHSLGGSFTSRINMDLRETKGWSYGTGTGFQRNSEAVPFAITAPVQADRTADSLAAIDYQLRDYLGSRGSSQEEIDDAVADSISSLPGRFETSGALLNALILNWERGRPDDYYEKMPEIYLQHGTEDVDAAMREVIDPDAMTYFIVGDADVVAPQLDAAGLDYRIVEKK